MDAFYVFKIVELVPTGAKRQICPLPSKQKAILIDSHLNDDES